ncbi:glycosyltransferase family 2 protein [Streptomyces sp. WMMC500]|uniref:glycosyltransferase family 2 protein n=1 Tax=Streptomyces sp. WMMC500 TaxID=3015154 RepID=UPI00248AD0A4|nr:glycosyltransferase family 2 protein [Streptomyces sp. WMMC500]WBB62954.1 glycosyltransferase family 2 protein [Streptomyces sp. WMMC500]
MTSPAAKAPAGPIPDVTVITGAYNSMPYITRSVTSVLEQTIGTDRLQILVINDGSTDGTGAELDRLAAENPALTVIHQENSGGPAGPRNVGLERATGRYVFFLDADDYLGRETLARMVETADANGTDVVVGKMIGVNGRNAPTSMYHQNLARTDVFSSRVYWTLNPMKLFRRELVEQHKLRFRPELKVGQDQPFTSAAYLHADGISVIGDYECVYWVKRDDGGNNTSVTKGTAPRIRFMRAMFELVGEHVPDGPRRDHLLARHYSIDLPHTIRQLRREKNAGDRQTAFQDMREMFAQWYTEGAAARLSVIERLLMELVRRGDLDDLIAASKYHRKLGDLDAEHLVENGRVYARYPFFRDPARNIPDGFYDVTDELPVPFRVGTAGLDAATGVVHLTGRVKAPAPDGWSAPPEMLLKQRGGIVQHRLPLLLQEKRDRDGYQDFRLDIDPATAGGGEPLAEALWDLSLACGDANVTRFGDENDLNLAKQPAMHAAPTHAGSGQVVTLYATRSTGHLTLELGEIKHRAAKRFEAAARAGARGDELAVDVRATVSGLPADAVRLDVEGPAGVVASAVARPGRAAGVTRTYRARLRLPREARKRRDAFTPKITVRAGSLAWTVPVRPAEPEPAGAAPPAGRGLAAMLRSARSRRAART